MRAKSKPLKPKHRKTRTTAEPVSSLSFVSQDPASGERPQQLIILSHGYGSNKHDLISLAPYFAQIAPDALFLSPDAPQPCEMGMGRQWFSLNPYEMEHMARGAYRAADTLNGFIDEQLSQHKLPPEKLALIGFSQGCMMSLHVGLRREQTIAGILGYSGALLDDGRLAEELASKPPVCLVHGEADPVVPFAAMGAAEAKLSALSVPVETHPRPHLPHSIDPEGIAIGQQFLRRIFA